MRPSECGKCRKRFERDTLMQAEMRHHAAKYGARSAESELNERYEERHAEKGHR